MFYPHSSHVLFCCDNYISLSVQIAAAVFLRRINLGRGRWCCYFGGYDRACVLACIVSRDKRYSTFGFISLQDTFLLNVLRKLIFLFEDTFTLKIMSNVREGEGEKCPSRAFFLLMANLDNEDYLFKLKRTHCTW